MDPLSNAIREHLAESTATAKELAFELARSEATVRNALARLCFEEGLITCDTTGRYHLRGDPIPNGRAAIGPENG